VPAITFSSLIETYGTPHYVKIDIEGSDLLCIEDLLELNERPPFVSFERSPSLGQQLKELRLLKQLGYLRFQLVDQHRVPSQVSPLPAREGTYIDDRFEYGSSGLFGAELPGVWLTFGETVTHSLVIFARNKRIGLLKRIPMMKRFAGHGSWYDLHAALSV
jgi:hypothetical protein